MPTLDAIGIVVSDMARAIEFFRLLGVPFVDPANADVVAEAQDHVEAKLPNGLRLMLDREDMIRSFMPEWRTPVGQRQSLAFLCDSPAEVDATVERVAAAGFKIAKAPWDAFWGQRYAVVENADGLAVDLFAPLPR